LGVKTRGAMVTTLTRYCTPLRYPGGKAKLAKYVKEVLKKNRLADGHYVEAYAGGAAIAVELLLHEYVSHVHINDISRPLYMFWRSVLTQTDRFARKIRDTRLTIRAWDRHKNILRHAAEYDELDVGFAFFFLNRTNRSGILNAGVIGGRDQSGDYGIDARYNARNLIARVEAIANLQSRISVSNEDALIFLRGLLPTLPKKSLIYLDPPYYVKGKDLYPDHYGHEDHQEIAKYMSDVRGHNWVVSYDDVQSIRSMYKSFRGIQYELNYSARESRNGREVMYFCDGLQIPSAAGTFTPLAHIRAASTRGTNGSKRRRPAEQRTRKAALQNSRTAVAVHKQPYQHSRSRGEGHGARVQHRSKASSNC
jgi:DNA adenine methylase